jgi:hypothetical protein
MSSETQTDEYKKLCRRIKKLEREVKARNSLAIDYEVEMDNKISNLYNTLKIVSAKLGVDMDYDYRKANIKKRSKRKKNKSRKKRKTKRKSK